MEEIGFLEELSKLANIAAIPVVIVVTNLLKKHFSFKHRSNLLAFFVALAICSGWGVYELTPEQFGLLKDGGGLAIYKFVVELMITSFATWFAASKAYDLVLGDRKRERILVGHKNEIRKLKEKVRDENEENSKDSEISEKLRSI